LKKSHLGLPFFIFPHTLSIKGDFMRSILLFVFLVVGLQVSATDFTTTCANFAPPLRGGYCIHTPTRHRSRDIVYHLHGRDGSQLDWQDRFNYPEQIRTEWKKHHAYLPTVISISFGPLWLLAEKNASPYSGLFEAFTQQVIPSLEASLGGLRGRRIIVGESMGGFNTSQMALKTNLFQKAAILCAPMSEVSPFDTPEVIKAYIEKLAAWDYYKDDQPNLVYDTMMEAVQLVKGFYPTEKDYQRANPLLLAASTHTHTQLYVAAGYYDKYSLYEANEKFVGVLQRHGRQVKWHPQWGGHCAMDIPSLARFLVN
jgi:hypothetical protein